MPPRPWPSALWLVRHGESVGNVASDDAYRQGLQVVDTPGRDADVELTDVGVAQAEALGRWVAGLPAGERPEVAVVSPYLRARHTAALALPGEVPITVDERLRDRELGVLDGLTWQGVEARFPAEAAARRKLGKYYHRPAGGESWADVELRVRAALADLRDDHACERVVVVAHDVVILMVRAVVEGLGEAQALDIGARTPVRNCSVTRYLAGTGTGTGRLELQQYNGVVGPGGSPVTAG